MDQLVWANDEPFWLGQRLGVSPVLNADEQGGVWISPPVYRGGYYRLSDEQVWTAGRLCYVADPLSDPVSLYVDAPGRLGLERSPNGAGVSTLYGVYGDQSAEADPDALYAWLTKYAA